jgi:hypothetical protein
MISGRSPEGEGLQVAERVEAVFGLDYIAELCELP